MDSRADIPLSPSYSRDPSAAVAAATSAGPNLSSASFGLVSAGAPPSTDLARNLFRAPRPAGGGAPAPAVTHAPFSKLPNAPAVKKTIKKVCGKKKKAVDGSTRPPKKKLARRATDVAATEARTSSFVPPAANAHNMFDGMPTSFNDETYMTTMGVGCNNSHWSQINDVHLYNHEFEVDKDGEGIVDTPKGRAGNYTMDEDVLLCNTWLKLSRDARVGGDQSREAYWIRMKEHFDLYNKSGIDRTERSLRFRWSTINKDYQKWATALKAVDTLNPSGTNDRDRLTIAQNLFQGEDKKSKKGKIKKGIPFTLPHCCDALKDDEKWRPHEGVDEESNKRKRTILIWIMMRKSHQVMEAREALHQTRLPTPNQIDQVEARKREKKRRRGKETMS
ncbi:putative receptor protein kinase ZmPK1 [Hordeum vulgare]|nr:putative receptor protein kinase ZmPK1 [Hordeum vulgare]